ncbi:hypothetical protein OXX69_003886 [Metschnikowia pulcherrima]
MAERLESLRSTLRSQVQFFNDLGNNFIEWYKNQPKKKQVLYAIGAVFGLAAAVIVLIFHNSLIAVMVDVSDSIRKSKFGGLALFIAIFFVGFPPLLGFSALSMLCGMVYGFPGGWPLLAAASITGSFASFMVYRYFLRNQAESLVARNEKFRAFAEILKEDASLFLLILLRLCPLPYSLSNGALAAIPNLPASTYLMASLITSPKMFMHVFIGHTIKNLGDAERPASAKALDVFSILLTGCAVSLASFIIYKRMQQKLDSYHEGDPNSGANYDDLVFGNFDEDPESGHNLELNSTEYDDDNFIIAEDDDFLAPRETDERVLDLPSNFDDSKPPKYRDY